MKLCDFYVFGLVDGCGDTLRDVVTDPSDTILIQGYLPTDHPDHPSEYFSFESDAHHLKDWAEENGLTAFKHGYNFEDIDHAAVA